MQKWKPLQPASVEWQDYSHPKNACFVQAHMDYYGSTRDEAIKAMSDYDAECRYWRNDLYQVQERRFFNKSFQTEMAHLNIRRIDGAAIFDWRHRQLIKNQLIGEECEGFEVYPAESRLSDTSNKYHLWVFTDPAIRLPVKVNGDDRRDVIEEEIRSPAGARQRRILR